MVNTLFSYHIVALVVSAGNYAGIIDICHINGIAAAQLLRRKGILNSNAPAGTNTVKGWIGGHYIATGTNNKGGETGIVGFLTRQLRGIPFGYSANIEAHAFLC